MSGNRFKFRVWDGEQYVSPDYITRDGVAHWKEHSIPQSSNKLEQFTGLKDCNGVEIYEGDVLEDMVSSTHDKMKVVYLEGCFCGEPIPEDGKPLDCLVKCLESSSFWGIIGNVPCRRCASEIMNHLPKMEDKPTTPRMMVCPKSDCTAGCFHTGKHEEGPNCNSECGTHKIKCIPVESAEEEGEIAELKPQPVNNIGEAEEAAQEFYGKINELVRAVNKLKEGK